MKMKLMSDIHNEFGLYEIEPDEFSKETVLVLAGDIDLWYYKDRLTTFIEGAAEYFYHVVYIGGNHEWYGGDITHDIDEMILWAKGYHNIHFLENSMVKIDDVNFVGSTLWTDMKNASPAVMAQAAYGMNDFRKISIAGEPYTPMEWLALNTFARSYLESTLRELDGQKVVVVTHHGPTEESIAECYSGQGDINYAYVNTLLEKMIGKYRPAYWFHGHTHVSHNHMVYDTNVICNPRGYHGYSENPNFNPEMVVEL